MHCNVINYQDHTTRRQIWLGGRMLQLQVILLLLLLGEHLVDPPLPLAVEAEVGLHLGLRQDGLEDGLLFRRPLRLGKLHHGKACSRWHLTRNIVILFRILLRVSSSSCSGSVLPASSFSSSGSTCCSASTTSSSGSS